MNSRAIVSLVLILLAASSMLARPHINLKHLNSAFSPYQPFGPGVHRTYRLRGGPGSQYWNGTLPGPGLNASDGDTVTIMLQSVDGVAHSWFLDFNSNLLNDTNEAATMSPDFTSTTAWTNFTFTASLGTVIPHGGTFLYECRQHPRFMNGNFKFNAGPVASFTHSPLTPLAGSIATFDASSSWPTTGSAITDFSWNFGDGNTTSSGSNPTIKHVYATNNTYSVVLAITDSMSQSAQATGSITILHPPPTPFDYKFNFSSTELTVTAGQDARITFDVAIVTGTSENVSLTTLVSPATSTIQAVLNRTSGLPTFSAGLLITTTGNSLCDPARPASCMLLTRVLYTVKIIAVSNTGAAHNATLTLNIVPVVSSPSLDYVFLAEVGAVTALAVLAGFLVFRSRRKSRLQKLGSGTS